MESCWSNILLVWDVKEIFSGLEGESEESDQDEGRDKRLIVQSYCTGCIVVSSVTTQWWTLDGLSWGMKNGFSEYFTRVFNGLFTVTALGVLWMVQGCWLGMYGCTGVHNELFIVLALWCIMYLSSLGFWYV